MYFSTSKITVGVAGASSDALTQSGDAGEKDVFILKNKTNLSNNDKIFTNMYINGLFGGLYTITEKEPTEHDGRNDTYTATTFTVGDILVVYDDDYATDTYVAGEKNMYMYLGNNKFATVANGKLILIDEQTGARLIESLLGQNCFVALRPSYSMNKKISKIEVTTFPQKMEYVQNIEQLDLTGGILTVTYDNNSSINLPLTNENIKVTGFTNEKVGTNEITLEFENFKTTINIEIVSKNDEVENPDIEGGAEDNTENKVENPPTGKYISLIFIITIVVSSLGFIVLRKKDWFLKI